MGRSFLIIFSIALIAFSSCGVRNYLVRSFGINYSVKAKGGKLLNQREVKLICDAEAEENNHAFLLSTNEITKKLSVSPGFRVSPLNDTWQSKEGIFSELYRYFPLDHSIHTVPIYLRIGKLILYN